MIVTGKHPYLSGKDAAFDFGLSELSGPVVTPREIDRNITSSWFGAWVPLAGGYCTASTEDCDHLLSLLWDLSGQPTHPGGQFRQAANYVVVKERDGLHVYRHSAEVAALLREQRKRIPPSKKKEERAA